MKKFVVAMGLSILGLAGTASAADSKTDLPIQGTDAIAQGYEWDALCRDAIHLQEQRVHDLREGVNYDRQVEAKLIEGIVARERDAGSKEEHARRWRSYAANSAYAGKRDAFNKFADWLENEARSDRTFAQERRTALQVINRQWNQTQNAIAGHERQLADLRAFCGG